MTPEETIKDIRKRCRLAMNGIISSSMSRQGLKYRLNFGVSLQKIKEIARYYSPNKELAGLLWKEDVRELKILSTLLFPANDFTKVTANQWILEINNQEIREQVCINLFQNLSFAAELAYNWSNHSQEAVRTTGYWLLARLLIIKKIDDEIGAGKVIYVFEDIVSDTVSLRNSALLALKHIGRMSETNAKDILNKIERFNSSSNPLEKEVYDNLDFEFEYYHKSL